MKEEALIIEIQQNFKKVFSQQIPLYEPGVISMVEVPPGILRGDYAFCQIRIIRREVNKP